MLASNINLLTHYAKGTLLLFVHILLELLIKLLFCIFPHGTYSIACTLYLALEEGSPLFKQIINPFYL